MTRASTHLEVSASACVRLLLLFDKILGKSLIEMTDLLFVKFFLERMCLCVHVCVRGGQATDVRQRALFLKRACWIQAFDFLNWWCVMLIWKSGGPLESSLISYRSKQNICSACFAHSLCPSSRHSWAGWGWAPSGFWGAFLWIGSFHHTELYWSRVHAGARYRIDWGNPASGKWCSLWCCRWWSLA